jgi:hypothetical protein
MTSKKYDFKYGGDKRPLRPSPNALAAVEQTFGVVTYTASNPPRRATVAQEPVHAASAR